MSTWKKVIAVTMTIISLLLFSVNIFGQSANQTGQIYQNTVPFRNFSFGYGGAKNEVLTNCQEVLSFDVQSSGTKNSKNTAGTYATAGESIMYGKSIPFGLATFKDNPTLPDEEITWNTGGMFYASGNPANTFSIITFYSNGINFGAQKVYDPNIGWYIGDQVAGAPTIYSKNGQNGVLWYTSPDYNYIYNQFRLIQQLQYKVSTGTSGVNANVIKKIETNSSWSADGTTMSNKFYIQNQYAHSSNWVNFSAMASTGYIVKWGDSQHRDFTNFTIGASSNGYVTNSLTLRYTLTVEVVNHQASGTAIMHTPTAITISGTYYALDSGTPYMSGNTMRVQLIPYDDIKQRIMDVTGQNIGLKEDTYINIMNHEIKGSYQINGAGEMNFTFITDTTKPILTDSVWLKQQVGNNYFTNVSSSNDFNMIDFLGNVIDDFFNIELFGLFSIGSIVYVCLCIGVIFFFLKVFMGG